MTRLLCSQRPAHPPSWQSLRLRVETGTGRSAWHSKPAALDRCQHWAMSLKDHQSSSGCVLCNNFYSMFGALFEFHVRLSQKPLEEHPLMGTQHSSQAQWQQARGIWDARFLLYTCSRCLGLSWWRGYFCSLFLQQKDKMVLCCQQQLQLGQALSWETLHCGNMLTIKRGLQ